ncbi:hypothetical protein ABB37_03327 [Leptomonas pyrrhocoris]|uniref:Uncharacterized protein n=1 Tax=Leptomonas pyrrhocoris TaxID=157538 RepID=A0A0M9G4Q7_LEPPY|nr:hypothetical protein ABB37_03327 [Leptomonas pyrrhocoris]KPA82207.1 hypothetical protein ABB37_03327 [Leptomonas pyrrhocoris]|eukprot:XP_015660646.1 hypothetical protein ABB37_03327 [Leptomonas pyrrhocoris]
MMFRAHPPAAGPRPRSAASATPARQHKGGEGRSKRCRSPCNDELRYKELQRHKQNLQQRVRQQVEVLAGLEESILDFYYTHTIRYEPLLQQHASSPSTSALSDDVIKLFPELSGPLVGGDDSAAGRAPSAVPSKTRYYYDSALMRLYREAAIQERDLAQLYAGEEAKVTATERQIQNDIIDGALASQLSTERDAREALSKLQAALATLQSKCSEREASIGDVEATIEATEKAVEACTKRKALLEAKKQEQMDNAEKIKEEVAVFRRSVEAAARELEKRTRNNQSLEEEIARRKALLRRRRKE